MSGDVQPRKRKDRRRKRDQNDSKLDGETTFSRKQSVQDDDESSHGVHITKMGNEDVHLHVHHEHGTGGHWCAKLFFFSLLVVLVGLVGLIILENRGLSDLDTPLSESRYSNYFDGWVEEHRDDHEHDEHDSVQASIEDHDEHDEPFEEEDDQSQDDNDHDDDEDDDHEEADEDEEEEDDENDDDKNDDDDQTEEENASLNAVDEDDDDDDDDKEPDKNDDDDDNNQTAEDDTQEGQTIEDDDDDNDDNDNDDGTTQETYENDNEDDEEEDDDNDNDDDDNDDKLSQNDENDDDGDDDGEDLDNDDNVTQEESKLADASDDDNDDPFDEDDDDGTFESLEKVVENDAEELLLLQEKARQQSTDDDGAADDDDDGEAAPSWASSLAVKIGVGVALAFVARHVLIRKNPNTKYSEEEIEIEEEIEEEIVEEYIESDDNAEQNVDADVNVNVRETKRPVQDAYVPETFEQLNAMYRSSNYQQVAAPSQVEHTIEPTPIATTSATAAAAMRNKRPTTTEQESPREYGRDCEDSNVPADGAYARDYVDDDVVDGVGDYMMYNDDDGAEISDEDEDELDDLDIDDDEEEEEDVDDDEDLLDDISDVDDSDLMNRLEAKYGRLPPKEFESDEDAEDPSWIQIKVKDTIGGGPQAIMDDDFHSLERELRDANEEMLREGSLAAFDRLSRKYPDQPSVFLAKAQALDRLAAQKYSNKLLMQAIEAYKRYLAFGEIIQNHTEYRQIAEHCIERMRFIGYLMQAIPVHEALVERFPNEAHFRNQLAVSLLMLNRLPEAKRVLENTLERWPSDGFASVHYGFVLKQHDKDYENAVIHLRDGIKSNAPGTRDGRFFFNLGEALQRLGRDLEAQDVFQWGAELDLFPSAYQRSLYNEPNLRGKPFWSIEETMYAEFFHQLEANWLAIRQEGLALLNEDGLFLDEAENLRDSGDWKQFELFTSGQQRLRNCQRAPFTCALISQFKAAAGCRRGQVKFSVMHGGTHVWPHCGPTNCRLRAHLGLVVPSGTYLRVAETVTSWTEGKFLIFDDSFEHEVWHNGTGLRLVLIVDVWHPDLSDTQRQSLSTI